jgi:recombinational DNA repair protein RecR
MQPPDPKDLEAILDLIRGQASREALRITQHAQQEMAEEEIALADVLEALHSCQILENYPEHRRGSCCLVCGYTRRWRPLHVVCTTAQPLLILITVYEPKPPKWVTPTQRGPRP